MKKRFSVLIVFLVMVVGIPYGYATNGDNLMNIGPISRSMGGVGIAAPQDAISAVFANPAAMCFGPFCPNSEFNFAGTLFMPKVDAKINLGGTTYQANSTESVYAIPAIGLSVPITNALPLWRFGLAAYGVTGLGVDYRNTALDQSRFAGFGGFPLVAGEYTGLQIMKFAPSIAFQPDSRFSIGLATHIDYATLDLRSGSSNGYGFGVQLGTIYKIHDRVSMGLTYLTPQTVKHAKVRDFDGDGSADDLELEAPQQVGLGVAFDLIPNMFLIELNGKWINWNNAKGYSDFDWKDQYVFGVGAQYKVTPKLALRAGYNYGNNPVSEHNNFVGFAPKQVQGKTMPTYYYETFRAIGFPAVVEHHVTFGIGYEFSNRFAINLGYTHAFSNSIKERGTALNGQPVTIESNLSENSIEFGLTWRF
ncbi:MAG: outer membrane protein transport protein [Deltaproteobacteria bacterium]|nr:outer membrane protein transport protein [Deltaproteobacteria bacterium]